MVRLSLVGDEWQTVRGRVRRLATSLRHATRSQWQWLWVVERNPRGTGHHVHALQRGPYVPQPVLQALCRREGLGIPWIARARRADRASTYGLKGALAVYELKSAGAGDHLELNGGRLAHWSRGWWGRPYREVVRALSANGSDPGPWVRERRPGLALKSPPEPLYAPQGGPSTIAPGEGVAGLLDTYGG